MQAIGTERDALDAVTAGFFKGLGDVNRLKILEFLRGGKGRRRDRRTSAPAPESGLDAPALFVMVRLRRHTTRWPLCAVQLGKRQGSSGQRGPYHGLGRYRRM